MEVREVPTPAYDTAVRVEAVVNEPAPGLLTAVSR
jgi:hypothetical protein